MINKISDIQVGGDYTILFIKDEKFARPCVVKAIINEREDFHSDKTEIYVDIFNRGKWLSSNLVYFCEIGIGENKKEAIKNYGRFNFEENSEFESSFKNVKSKLGNRFS